MRSKNHVNRGDIHPNSMYNIFVWIVDNLSSQLSRLKSQNTSLELARMSLPLRQIQGHWLVLKLKSLIGMWECDGNS